MLLVIANSGMPSSFKRPAIFDAPFGAARCDVPGIVALQQSEDPMHVPVSICRDSSSWHTHSGTKVGFLAVEDNNGSPGSTNTVAVLMLPFRFILTEC